MNVTYITVRVITMFHLEPPPRSIEEKVNNNGLLQGEMEKFLSSILWKED